MSEENEEMEILKILINRFGEIKGMDDPVEMLRKHIDIFADIGLQSYRMNQDNPDKFIFDAHCIFTHMKYFVNDPPE